MSLYAMADEWEPRATCATRELADSAARHMRELLGRETRVIPQYGDNGVWQYVVFAREKYNTANLEKYVYLACHAIHTACACALAGRRDLAIPLLEESREFFQRVREQVERDLAD